MAFAEEEACLLTNIQFDAWICCALARARVLLTPRGAEGDRDRAARAAAIVEEVASRTATAGMVFYEVKALALRVRCCVCAGDEGAAERERARLTAALRRWRGRPVGPPPRPFFFVFLPNLLALARACLSFVAARTACVFGRREPSVWRPRRASSCKL